MATLKSRRGSKPRPKPAPQPLGTKVLAPPIVDERDELLAAADAAVKFLKRELDAIRYDTPECRYYTLRNAYYAKTAGTRTTYSDGSHVDHPPVKGGAA